MPNLLDLPFVLLWLPLFCHISLTKAITKKQKRIAVTDTVKVLYTNFFFLLAVVKNPASLNTSIVCKVVSPNCLLINLKGCWLCELAKLLGSPVHQPVPAAEGCLYMSVLCLKLLNRVSGRN